MNVRASSYFSFPPQRMGSTVSILSQFFFVFRSLSPFAN